MKNYKWTINPEINQLIIELESIKLSVNNLPSKPSFEKYLRQHSLLKSAVYSARIEGFTDTINSPKKESQNLLKAYQYIFSDSSPKKLSNKLIKTVHKTILKDLSSYSGSWRTEPWAIFNQSGTVVYLAPPHFEVPKLMDEYPKYINKLKDHPSVKAAVAQFIFEKIHPFADGNGRVGRLISAFVLEKNGFGFKGQAPFEEYINNHRADYYYHLESSIDCTSFVKFFLESLVFQSKAYLMKLNTTNHENPEESLLPRRRELLNIIRDHPNCSFNFLKRRFLVITSQTLHYDLLKLQKAGFIRKLGATKGVVYTASNSN